MAAEVSSMRARSARAWWAGRTGRWVVLGAVAACGGTAASGFGKDSGPGDTGGGAHPDSGGAPMMDSGVPVFGMDSGKKADGPADGPEDASAQCPPSATLIYVTGTDNHLWSFYPQALLYPDAGVGPAFTDIGAFSCLNGPTHMTVDRQAFAWVVSGGRIYKASTKDATCSAVTTWTPHPLGFGDFALTFVGVSSAVDDNLYMLSQTQLGLFDVATGAVTDISGPPVSGAWGDMTSNGDGTLYFLEDATKLTLYDMSPSNGAVLSTQVIPNATGGGDQALAFWGGSFWAFEDNVIHQYDPKTMTTTTHGTAPLSITGAGQSTCVPKVPPPPPPPPK